MINNKELQSVSTMGAFDRYRYFIKKIADSGMLWIIKNNDGEFALSEVESNVLLSMWSAKDFIKSCLNGVWEKYIPKSVTLEEFETELMPIIKSKNYLLDIFPVNNKAGFVVALEEFITDLNTELSNYG